MPFDDISKVPPPVMHQMPLIAREFSPNSNLTLKTLVIWGFEPQSTEDISQLLVQLHLLMIFCEPNRFYCFGIQIPNVLEYFYFFTQTFTRKERFAFLLTFLSICTEFFGLIFLCLCILLLECSFSYALVFFHHKQLYHIWLVCYPCMWLGHLHDMVVPIFIVHFVTCDMLFHSHLHNCLIRHIRPAFSLHLHMEAKAIFHVKNRSLVHFLPLFVFRH